MRRPLSLALTGALVLTGQASAADDVAGTTFHFLNFGLGPRLEAMGEAGTALAVGPEGLVWNPARLAAQPGRELSASWFNWLDGVQSGHFAYRMPIPRDGAFGLGVQALRVADIDNVTGADPIGQTDLAVVAGAGIPLGGGLSAGLSGKVLTGTLADERATGFALDGGVNFDWVEGWNVGAAVRNVGSSVAYGEGADEQLPTQAALGIAGVVSRVRFGLDGVWENGQGGHGRLGLEYGLGRWLALRAGSRLGADADRAVDPWSVGFGFRARPDLTLDYSFRSGELNASHRVGVQWALGGASAEPASVAMAESPREFYQVVLDEVIERALADFPRDIRDTVLVRPAATHESGTLVSESVVAKLQSWGLAAVAAAPVPDVPESDDPEQQEQTEQALEAAGLTATVDQPLLEFEVTASQYRHPRTVRERWIGPPSVARRAKVDLQFSLTDPGAESPRWNGQASWEREGFAAVARIPRSGGYPSWPGSRGGGKDAGLHPLVEPAIVTGIVAGLAVIFFSNREVGE